MFSSIIDGHFQTTAYPTVEKNNKLQTMIFEMPDNNMHRRPAANRLISTDETSNLDIETVRAWYKEYVNPGIEDILYTFSFGEEVVDRAEGVWIYFKNNRKIFDATGGMGTLNLGHNHPRILQARIRFQQMKRMEVHKA